jgi:glycosyltransferase involved in cell wall biosynthesis
MRVVIVSDFGSVNGGAAKVAIESARGLAEAGVEVVFACAIAPVSDKLSHPNISVEMFPGREIWQVESRLEALRLGVWNAAAGRFLADLLAKQPSGETVVHIHQWSKAFSPAGIAAAGASGLPVAYTLHEYFSFCPNGAYFDFPKGHACGRDPMSLACSMAHKGVRVVRQAAVTRALAALRDPVFVHVSALGRDVAQPFLPARARHVVIENMMEAERQALAPVAANRHALFLGRFTQEKGVETLARAARAAGMPVRFIGEGPYAARIRAADPQGEIVDWLAPEAVFDEIARARCVVAPSLWRETGPLVVPEAMALGVPVVASRLTGMAGRIRDGFDGLLVEPGDEQGLAAALTRLKDDSAAGAMGAAAYASYWTDPLTLDRHVGRTLDVYRRALGLAGPEEILGRPLRAAARIETPEQGRRGAA